MREEAVHAGLAHFVVAFRVHEEAEGVVEVAAGFADGADFVCGGNVGGAFGGGGGFEGGCCAGHVERMFGWREDV